MFLPKPQRKRREAAEISAQKKSIVGILNNVAELGAGRMEETIDKASVRDAAIGTGVAIDNLFQLTEKAPHTNIAIIKMLTRKSANYWTNATGASEQ